MATVSESLSWFAGSVQGAIVSTFAVAGGAVGLATGTGDGEKGSTDDGGETGQTDGGTVHVGGVA